MERLAERFTVIRYDKPGCGLSDREATDLSFEAQVAAALAVADAVRADRFAMFGASQGGQIAAAIAARHPGRVAALVLYGMCANGADLAPDEVRNSIVALVRAHWGVGSKLMTGIFVADPTAADVTAMGRMQREGASSEVASELLDVYYGTDIRALLPAVSSPTAVLHREQDTAAAFDLGREVASLIPGAQLVPLPGPGHLFYQGEWEPVLDATLAFLARAEEARACLAPAMRAFYQLPFERFERYCPYGTAEDVAEFLAPYVAAEFNLIPCAPDPAETIAAVGAVKNLL